jgi:NAD(P)-dependent dehydrogenase (short-subunit alcohol dehydrogenase family)
MSPQIVPIVRFCDAELALFARASGDFNPLHCDPAYARRTPFGQPVVFGVLAVIKALATCGDVPGYSIRQLTIQFTKSLICDVDYEVHSEMQRPERRQIWLRDGSRTVLTMAVDYRPGTHPVSWPPTDTPAVRSPMATHDTHSLTAGYQEVGDYHPDRSACLALSEQPGFGANGLGTVGWLACLWSSYLVGMRLPGKAALFSTLKLTIEPDTALAGLAADYDATVVKWRPHLRYLQVQGHLRAGGQVLATAELEALMRPSAPVAASTERQIPLPTSTLLANKRALVTGGSRGLGAQLCRLLASQGCHVYVNYWQSAAEADALCQELSLQGLLIETLPGDVGDPAWARQVAQSLEGDGIDFLICNATPPIVSAPVEPAYTQRMRTFMDLSIGQVLEPLAALMPALRSRHGGVVLISSAFVDTCERDWAHYTAAKTAAETLIRTAVKEVPELSGVIVHAPRLLTEQTLSPIRKSKLLPAAEAAARIVARLCEPMEPGTVKYLTIATDGSVTAPPAS